MNPLYLILILVSCLGFGSLLGYLLYNKEYHSSGALKLEIDQLNEEAKKKSQEIITEAKSFASEIKETLNSDEENWQIRSETLNESIQLKEQSEKRKSQKNEELKQGINLLTTNLEEIKKEIDAAQSGLHSKLQEKAGISFDDLKREILANLEHEILSEKEHFILKHEQEVKEELSKISKKIVLYAIQRFSGATSVERHNTNVVIPKDIMKGMLIGKNGVNIAYLESLFPGLQFIFEHEPKTLTIAGFNLLQRNIAALTVKKLLHKKSISPAEINFTHKKAKEEIDQDIMKEGRKALKKVGIVGCKDRLIWLVGRLKYRTSYRQNILKHSIEMAFFAEMIASEIGADTHIAKVATFFHDIGKAVDHDIDTDEGHDYLTKEILEENGFEQDIVHAAFVHHDAEPQRIPEAHIVKAADAISGGRPGARQETLDSYIERITKLEELANSIEGVKKSYAVAAGREIRIFLDPQLVKDEAMEKIAERASTDIEDNLVYPGKIKVNVIRILKATEVAK